MRSSLKSVHLAVYAVEPHLWNRIILERSPFDGEFVPIFRTRNERRKYELTSPGQFSSEFREKQSNFVYDVRRPWQAGC